VVESTAVDETFVLFRSTWSFPSTLTVSSLFRDNVQQNYIKSKISFYGIREQKRAISSNVVKKSRDTMGDRRYRQGGK